MAQSLPLPGLCQDFINQGAVFPIGLAVSQGLFDFLMADKFFRMG